jgi:hypothetical protein
MLEVTNQPSLFPATGPLPVTLNAFVSPAQNLVNGYNIAEQTCFHKTTVSNLIPALRGISALAEGLGGLVRASASLVTASTTLVGDVTTLVGRTRTLLADATTLIGTVATLVTTVIGLVATIIGSLTGIVTATRIAGFAAVAAAASCALFWIPGVGYGFLAAGAIAIAALLAIVFFVISGAIAAVITSLTGVTGALATLTGPLTTLTGSVGSVNAILSSTALTSDVTRSLAGVSTALTDLQNALSAQAPLVTNTVTTLDQRADTLQEFFRATPTGGTIVPRAHLEDTYRQAVRIYNEAITTLRTLSPPVWTAMQTNPDNDPQINPRGNLDQALACSYIFGD